MVGRLKVLRVMGLFRADGTCPRVFQDQYLDWFRKYMENVGLIRECVLRIPDILIAGIRLPNRYDQCFWRSVAFTGH